MAELEVATLDELINLCIDVSRTNHDRAHACLLVGQLGIRDAVWPLLQLARSAEDDLLAWEAFAALGAIGSRRVTRPLMGLLKETASPIRRKAIVHALSMLRDRRARLLLSRILLSQNEDEQVKESASEALGLVDSTRSGTHALVMALRDESARIRYSALCALGALRDKKSVVAIKPLLEDDSVVEGEGTVAARAALVLSEIEAAAKAPKKYVDGRRNHTVH